MERIVKRAQVSVSVDLSKEDVHVLSAPTVYNDNRLPPCKKCQQERYRNKEYKQNNKKGKKKQNRANTPIVIQLKDTLKAAIQQKQKNKQNWLQKQESNELKDEGDIETDNSSDRSEIHWRSNRNRKKSKNLSSYFNDVRKTGRKDFALHSNTHKRNGIESPFTEKLVAEYVLNNVNDTQAPSKLCHKRNIVECDNVEVICNDLTGVEPAPEDTESEISSTTSSSEIHSDSDISNSQETNGTHEFTSYELQQLAAYTTGCPLVRYDCAPANCPQCQWYSQVSDQKPVYKHPTSKSSSGKRTRSKKFAHKTHRVPIRKNTATVELDNISNTESDVDVSEVTDTPSEASADTDTSVCDNNSPVSKGKSFQWEDRRKSQKKQLLDIDIAGRSKCLGSGKVQNDLYLDSVYIDLTDTDVTFTVYYHHSFPETDSVYSNNYASPFTRITGPHHHDFVPFYSVPYSYQQYLYWSTLYNPMYTLPMPFCLEPKESLPKTAMVPPGDLPKCKCTHSSSCHVLSKQLFFCYDLYNLYLNID